MNSGTRQYVSFELDGRLFGLDIRIVKEVNRNTQITSVPRSPEHIRGLVNIRGQVVLVIDVAVVLGQPPRPITELSQVVILKTAQEIQTNRNLDGIVSAALFSDKPVGFLVDRVGDVVTVERGELSPPPPHLEEANARFVEGVLRLEGQLLVVLSAAEML